MTPLQHFLRSTLTTGPEAQRNAESLDQEQTFHLFKCSQRSCGMEFTLTAVTASRGRENTTLLCDDATALTRGLACLQMQQPPCPGHLEGDGRERSPASNSSKSSMKNSLRGGRFGLFRVLRSCWILEDTLLLTGTPVMEEGH